MASLQRLKELNEYDRTASFRGTGVTAGNTEISESQLFESVFRSISTVYTSERAIQYPGMANAKGLIRGAVKRFSREVVESNFRPPQEAGVDDVTVQAIRPETFSDSNQTTRDDWDVSLSATGSTTIIDDGSGNAFSLDDDEWVIVTDIVEYNTDNHMTAIQHEVDGNAKEAEEIRAQIRNSDLQVYPLVSPEFAKEEYKLEAKSESSTGTTSLAPVGVHIAKGDLVGDLT